ncbi:MAG: aminotransferase class I/II-fold pyridoxal phosphate-dependent enzyme [Bacteroidales bacterium]|nr:aminotransferase class I/II-fold pyridoxal phosphate-dependent enzyme [Bacteroidota bacterium]MBL6950097.1 aminotransferase class I/II-fold pyridoxal phosphate-dependent enzyme [Bacteroidales bacterium]
MDIFEKVVNNMGPLGKYADVGWGYFYYPKLEGEISNRMKFRGNDVLVWSLNNYLGLANHPEVRETDARASEKYGLAYPMGARMMSGQTEYHEELERVLAKFENKEASFLLNYGYQGMVSIIDSLIDRNDVVVYDSDSHACILDGLRMHLGKRIVYPHNDLEKLEISLKRAKKIADKSGGGILVITEGVYGMVGDLGNLPGILKFKEKYGFRLLVDDAHGFGTMGKTGAGTSEEQNVMDGVDVYFGTFAKAMAGIGGFVASDKPIIKALMYKMRSQIFAKSLPMPMVIGALKRMELIKSRPELKENLWKIVRALQNGLKDKGFNLGKTESPVTPVILQGGLGEATQIVVDLRENYGIFCSMVIYPVVPKGVILLRLIPTAVHTLEDVKYTIDSFSEVREKLDAGKYSSGEVPPVADKY